ncbi:hypothetical protein MAPG_06421 [Magnaporthiopsis poae ATCC 64411]|uniref:Uncharacterized protein n=1 Tax=Magnaporthiopsis poae (strain ATCC 64411 / 73-15) TaxID=644358 RepID=A0A0C4E1Z5_MAGP6|nr:hypothetical protein MAPG_06421 [Magnaporthiopsis poae ATCC 64411]
MSVWGPVASGFGGASACMQSIRGYSTPAPKPSRLCQNHSRMQGTVLVSPVPTVLAARPCRSRRAQDDYIVNEIIGGVVETTSAKPEDLDKMAQSLKYGTNFAEKR